MKLTMANLIFKISICLLFSIPFCALAQNNVDSTFHRHYELGIAPSYDINNVTRNGLTAYKISQDIFTKGIQPKLSKKAGNVAGGLWSFATTYLSMVWSHEFGHTMRAHQVGGRFKMHDFGLPVPYTTMHLPTDASFQDEALSVIGGFEVNYLTSKSIQDDFYEFDGLYNDELSYAFAHKLMHPIYTSLVTRHDPKNKDTWINTSGDPVHIIKPVWQRYSNDQIFLPDSSVNPGLVDFYNESVLLATFINLLDPVFYKQGAAFFGDVNDGKRPWYIIGNEKNGWSYGTMFNTSILGYEVFLNNYIKWNNRLFILRLKTGRPFKNNSATISSPNFYTSGKIKIGALVEIWDQDIFGIGGMVHSDFSYSVGNKLDLNFQLGYKTKGYTLGRVIENDFIGWLGLRYNIHQ